MKDGHRRATRCKSGSVRELAIRGDRRDNDELILGLATEIGTLTEAEQQLRNSGTLTQDTGTWVSIGLMLRLTGQGSPYENTALHRMFGSRLPLASSVLADP